MCAAGGGELVRVLAAFAPHCILMWRDWILGKKDQGLEKRVEREV